VSPIYITQHKMFAPGLTQIIASQKTTFMLEPLYT